MKSIEEKAKHPLFRELVTLEYILTWRYTDDFDRDLKRYMEIQDIIYNG